MSEGPGGAPEMEYWGYDRPPTAFELVRNNFASRLLRVAIHALARASLRTFHRLEIRADERIRRAESRLIVANHASHLDVLALFSAFPLGRVNQVRSLAARDYFFGSPFWRAAAFFVGNALPLDRSGPPAEALRHCRQALREGACIVLFPEGTRTTDGNVHEFRPGVGMIVLKLDVPVIPAFIQGTFESLRKGRVLPRPRRIRVTFGEEVAYRGLADGREGWLHVARDLEDRVRRLAEPVGTGRADG
jgi:1-acyl-sn-glycerol-3-phosphate acyltransferase